MLNKQMVQDCNMNLPRKDKRGVSYLSYSQINTFKRDEKEYIDIYINGRPFEGNAYTDFGSKVGNALENNYFEGFKPHEVETLKKCIRLDEFERMTTLNYNDFYVLGFIDSNSKDYKTIIDYKTGGNKKEFQYSQPEYLQLCYYALSLRQETGVTPEKAYVNFIRREGNAFRGQELTVSKEAPLLIDVDISYNRLKNVYWETIKIAEEISKLFDTYN